MKLHGTHNPVHNFTKAYSICSQYQSLVVINNSPIYDIKKNKNKNKNSRTSKDNYSITFAIYIFFLYSLLDPRSITVVTTNLPLNLRYNEPKGTQLILISGPNK